MCIVPAQNGYFVVRIVGEHVYREPVIAWGVSDNVEAITPIDRAAVTRLDIVGPDDLMLNSGQPIEQWVAAERMRWTYKTEMAAE